MPLKSWSCRSILFLGWTTDFIVGNKVFLYFLTGGISVPLILSIKLIQLECTNFRMSSSWLRVWDPSGSRLTIIHYKWSDHTARQACSGVQDHTFGYLSPAWYGLSCQLLCGWGRWLCVTVCRSDMDWDFWLIWAVYNGLTWSKCPVWKESKPASLN